MTPILAWSPPKPAAWESTDAPLFEVVDGKNVELPPMGAFETSLSFVIAMAVERFSNAQNLGRGVHEMLFRFASDRPQRRPDVAYVSFARWARGRRVPRANAWAVIPELAIEVVSPFDLANEVIEKAHEYLAAGVQQVWLVWPTVKQVFIYSSPTEVRHIGADGVLDAEPILPGWRWPVSELFGPDDEEPAPAPSTNGDS